MSHGDLQNADAKSNLGVEIVVRVEVEVGVVVVVKVVVVVGVFSEEHMTELKRGLLIGRLGVPGSGKSHFVRTASAIGKTWVAITDPGEADGYDASVETQQFWDTDFFPTLDRWSASGWGDLLKALYALKDRADIAVVGIDSMTGVSELISHDVRKLTRSQTLKDVGEYGLGFQKYSGHLRQLLGVLKLLAVGGKHVICTFHIVAKEQEGAGAAKIEGGDLEFEERLLPALEGSIRQHVSGDFSVWAFSVLTGVGVGSKYAVTLLPETGVPAKTRLQPSAEGLKKLGVVNATRIPNDVKSVLIALGRE